MGALGYNFIKLYFEHSSKQPILTRLEAENVVQKNRGNIERCIKELASCLYVDFVFELHPVVGINVDIFVNTMAGSFDWEVVHPQWMIPNEFSGVGAYGVIPTHPDKNPAHPGYGQYIPEFV